MPLWRPNFNHEGDPMTSPRALSLPEPLSAFFAAKNAHDADAELACFAPDARVRDENQWLQGHAAIRDWCIAAARKYDATNLPLSVESTAAHTLVRSRVTGNFPGSPVELKFAFVLANDRISSLEITL
jgi:hypothetical protein